jgi:hypothetical protein
MEPGRPRDAEDGLGAAQVKIEPATGAPVTALRRAFLPGKRLRPQGCGEARWYHESFRLSSLSGSVRQDEGFFRPPPNQERKSINL